MPTSSYKQTQLFLVSLILCLISSLNGEINPISIKYNKSDLKKTLKELVDTYQIPLIYPSNIKDQKISADCDSCTVDSLLTTLLFNTIYDWKKIDQQYTIYKVVTDPYTITGQVFDEVSKETIPYANVYIPSLDIGTISNDEGVFSLAEIEAKNCTLHVSYIGYKTQKMEINFKKNLSPNIRIDLKQKIISSKNVFIQGKSREFMSLSNDPGRISFSPKHISTLPTIGEVDIFRSLQLLPGIHQGLGGTAELYIRGGRPDQNLVIIDGMPIYQKTHMFGFLSSIQAEAVKDVQVFKGGYPAKFGGRTSGLIGITNRVGNTETPRIKLYSNFTINSAQIELPIFSRGSFILTGRQCNNIVSTRLYKSVKDFITGDDNFNLISESANQDQRSSYSPQFTFQDINAVFSYLISPKNRVSFTYINGADIIDEKREFFGFQTIFEYDSTSISEDTEWSNQGTILNWSYYINPNWYTKFSIAKTGFSSRYNSKLFNGDMDVLPVQSTNEKNIFSDEIYSIYQRINLIPNHQIEFGINRSILSSNYQTNRISQSDSEQFKLSQNGYLQSIYLQDDWSFSKPIKINLGFRNTYYSNTNTNYFMPRLSLSYKITPTIKFESAFGKYEQYVHQFNSPMSTRGTKGTWLISEGNIPVISANSSHSSFSWENSFYDASISYYQRNSSGQYDFERYISPIAIFSDLSDEGHGSDNDFSGSEITAGSEIFIRRKNKPINGWVAYQYNNTKYSYNDIDDGLFFPADHDVTHEFKSVIMTSILNYDFTANWSYSSGRVFTHPNEINKTNNFQIIFNPETRNRERLKPVHHLDISISKNYVVDRFKLNAGISIYNIYNKKNISHKRYNPYTGGNIISDVFMLGITPTFFIQANL